MTDLPNGWAQTTLGAVAEYTNGRGFKKSEWSDSGRPIIRIQNLTGSGSSFNYFRGELLPKHQVKSGDLLVSWAATLSVHRWSDPREGALNQHIFKVEPFDIIDDRFLEHALRFALDDMYRSAHGSGMVHITRGKFESTPILLPPMAEQHRIVEVLEDHLSRLDSAEASLNAVEQRVRALSGSCADDAVLGRAMGVPLSSQPAAELRGRHDRFDYQALPPLPGNWEWKLAESLCESISSGSTPRADLMQQGRGEIPFLKVYNIDPAGYVDFTKNPTYVSTTTHRGQLLRSVTRPGDVVTNIVGPPLGKSAVIPDSHPEWNHNQAIVSFRAGEDIESDWLAACLRSPFIVNLLKSTARATAGQFNIALSTCRELPLPSPPIDVQRELLQDLSARQLALEHASASIRIARSRSIALRRSLLTAAFSGELVGSDPHNEPACTDLDALRA
ncbi:restriction endonuclease subunit S [Mycolicibacterium mengxianglii]|uniref:restriction endonuclease subunit S n=1 Tax=Mycolicibacterium mengxianglii TaxID=2736649 RepID=UPI0018D00236|nr:restriction endonuclease subunit S [Mycolicibacterium mengxianglii]